MTGLALALVGAYGVFLVFSAIAFGWHAMPMFGQTGSPFSARAQVMQPSVHSAQVLSRSP